MSISPLFDQQVCYPFTHHIERRRKMSVKQFMTIPGRGKELKETARERERERGAASILCSSSFFIETQGEEWRQNKKNRLAVKPKPGWACIHFFFLIFSGLFSWLHHVLGVTHRIFIESCSIFILATDSQ